MIMLMVAGVGLDEGAVRAREGRHAKREGGFAYLVIKYVLP